MNKIPLEPVFFSEIFLHVLDEGAGDAGRQVEGLGIIEPDIVEPL